MRSRSGGGGTQLRSMLKNGFAAIFRKRDPERGISGTTTEILPQTSPIESNLYMFPSTLRRYYQPLPSIVRIATVCLATWRAYVSTNWTKAPLFSFLLLRQTAVFLFRSVAWVLIAQTVLQDALFVGSRPSRVTMKTLMRDYFLPSPLSKYRPLDIDPIPAKTDASSITSRAENEPFTLGVHYLHYNNTDFAEDGTLSREENEVSDVEMRPSTDSNKKQRSFDAMYFQHGFGASSLSWLPVLPALAQRMNARVAIGHDTVGFGWTDRPRDRRWYRPRQGARIARAILGREARNEPNGPVCLVGHSMGSRSTLRLATQLPPETPKLVILSSPALGLIAPKPPRERPAAEASKPAKLAGAVSAAVARRIVRPVARYALRRVIGFRGFWRKGLEGIWGYPERITEDNDVLRYSWPAVGHGWEDGILNFASAQVLPADDELDDDYALMREVLDLPHTTVLIILGSRDLVIPTKSVERFMERVLSSRSAGEIHENDVPIVELEGLGHCAFEEDREAFCDAVEQLVMDHWDTRR